MSSLELWVENKTENNNEEVFQDPYSDDIMGVLWTPWEYWDIPLGIMGNVTIKYGNETFSLLDIKQQS